MYLEKHYRELREADLCASAYEFSERFLGKSRNYYSVLKARKLEPSIDALVSLEYALQKQVEDLHGANSKNSRTALGCLLMLERDVVRYRDLRCDQKIRTGI